MFSHGPEFWWWCPFLSKERWDQKQTFRGTSADQLSCLSLLIGGVVRGVVDERWDPILRL